MTREPRWLGLAVALAIHDRILRDHGGRSGPIDLGRLQAALASPQQHLAYGEPDAFDLAAAYASAIVRDHPFTDGNKRVAFTMAAVFLELNGHRLAASEPDALASVLQLVTRELDAAGFAAWLREHSSPNRPAGARKPRRKR